MADLDAIRLHEEQVREAEQLAIAGLAGYLQEATQALPDESRLCRTFYVYSEKFADLADWPSGRDTMAALDLIRMEKEVRRLDADGEE